MTEVNNIQRVVVSNPEILERWLGPLAEQMKQRIEGADLQQLFDEAQSAIQVVAAAVMQMPLEDPKDEATATNNLGDAGRLLVEAWALYRDPEESVGLTLRQDN